MGLQVNELCEEILSHYKAAWPDGAVWSAQRWERGPIQDLPASFSVLEVAPSQSRTMWTYATCCMSECSDGQPLELHLFSPTQYAGHVELLTAIAHYHCTGQSLGLGHTVNFGRPWMDESPCEYGLVSLPYLDGPRLEVLQTSRMARPVRFLWLVPITKEEREYKKREGLEALEKRLEEAQFDYLNPKRSSVV